MRKKCVKVLQKCGKVLSSAKLSSKKCHFLLKECAEVQKSAKNAKNSQIERQKVLKVQKSAKYAISTDLINLRNATVPSDFLIVCKRLKTTHGRNKARLKI